MAIDSKPSLLLFLIEDQVEGICFCEKMFLLADIIIDVTLRMPFLILSNAKLILIIENSNQEYILP